MTVDIALSTDLPTCLALRRVVFIDEQGVSEEDEVDGLDGEALHFLACLDGQPVGTARVLTAGDTGKIGRVCVLIEARGQGIGAALIRAAMADLRKRDGFRRARLAGQTHALGFYERLGFVAEGPVFMDAGIPHRWMEAAL